MSALTTKQQYRLEKLENAQRSCQSISQYAKEQNIPAQKLYQWRKTLKNMTTQITREKRFNRVVSTPDVSPYGLLVQTREARLQFSSLPDLLRLPELLKHCSSSS